MIVPEWLLDVALWTAVGVVGLATAALLLLLIREWRAGRLW